MSDDIDLPEIKRLAEAATPLQLDTSESVEDADYTCPLCDGEGELACRSYTNPDAAPIGVQFFGIGHKLADAEAYFRAVRPSVVLALLSRLAGAEQERDRLRVVALRIGDHLSGLAAAIRTAPLPGDDLSIPTPPVPSEPKEPTP